MRLSRLVTSVLPIAFGLVAITLAWGQPAVAQLELPPELLPDLQALPPNDIEIVKVRVGKNIETRLRFDTRVVNKGTGPFEVFPKSEDCDNDGDVRNDRTAVQRIFAGNGNGVFDRGADTISREVPVGCMIFHPKHQHWHIAGFANYALKSGSDTVASSEKVSFCMLDMYWEGPTGAQTSPYYNACGRNATMAISVNWADEYYSTLAGQYIDISAVPDGTYCLVNIANPPGDLTTIQESNENNNAAGVRVTIAGNTVSPRYPEAADGCGP